MSDAARRIPNTQPNRLKRMEYKYCKCGHPIGIEQTDASTTFFDEFDRERPIIVCPACNTWIKADKLQYSELQRKALVKAYRS